MDFLEKAEFDVHKNRSIAYSMPMRFFSPTVSVSNRFFYTIGSELDSSALSLTKSAQPRVGLRVGCIMESITIYGSDSPCLPIKLSNYETQSLHPHPQIIFADGCEVRTKPILILGPFKSKIL